MTNLKWEDPPEAARDRWTSVADELRANPGAWALISEESASSLATTIKDGSSAAFRPAGAFETRTSGIPGRPRYRVRIWCRYVGGAE